MKYVLVAFACLALAACEPSSGEADSAATTTDIAPIATDAPAGRYTLDKTHATLHFRVNHLGFSHYTGGFTAFDATLDFNPADPAAMQFEGTVDVASLSLPNPPAGFVTELLGKTWFEADTYPQITFRSTSVTLTSPNTADVTGDFTMHGVTKPLTLAVTFNGGYAGHPYDPNGRIGFSAQGTLNRSDFGIVYGIPEAGSTMGVSDAVDLVMEAEFSGPPLAAPE